MSTRNHGRLNKTQLHSVWWSIFYFCIKQTMNIYISLYVRTNACWLFLKTAFINSHLMRAAARLVTNTPRICHITPILKDLHWLPIKYRIEFKIVLLTFKCLYGLAPQYMVHLIAVAGQSRYNLRSRSATLLVLANARCLFLLLVTEPFSRQLPNCGTVFRWRSETFRASHVLSELSKRTFSR